MTRRPRDFYETAPFQTRALLAHVPEIAGRVLEPCHGRGAITSILTREGGLSVVTNDINRRRPADFHLNAARLPFWQAVGAVDWVISNPPYLGHLCLPIVRFAIQYARVGVALMLRLSFKEPTATGTRRRRLRSGRIVPASDPRGPFLALHPLSRELVLPRYSFTGRGTDSVTTAWMVWSRMPLSGPAHVSLYAAERTFAEPWRRAA